MSEKISKELMQNLHIARQLDFPKGRKGKDRVLEIIQRLGYIQIDTLQVVERAHHHTLWNRMPEYKPEYLDELQKDRLIFEYWGHAASYLPMDEYRFYRPRMDTIPQENGWEGKWFKDHGEVMDLVYNKVKEEGPLNSASFAAPTRKKGDVGWWNWKPAKIALELLFWSGKLMVTERRKFQRVYDLTERVLPVHIDITVPTALEMGEFQVRRAIEAHGVVSEQEINFNMFTRHKAEVKKVLPVMCESKEIIKVEVEGFEKCVYYTYPDYLNRETKLENQVYLLSPFDNLIINRKKLKEIFDFDYTLECYVPEAKRKYGYFVLPILWKNKFVGRLDAKADRKEGILVIRKLYFEPGFKVTSAFDNRFQKVLEAFAKFNGCEEVVQ